MLHPSANLQLAPASFVFTSGAHGPTWNRLPRLHPNTWFFATGMASRDVESD